MDGQRLYLFDEDLQKLEDKMVLNEFGLSEIVKHGLLLRYGFQNTLAQIFVKSMTGKIFTIKIKLSATVKDLKAKIEAKEGICPDQQRIHMTGKCRYIVRFHGIFFKTKKNCQFHELNFF